MAAALLCWAACCVRGPTGEPLAAQVVRVPMPRPRPNATGGDTLTVTVSPASVSFLLTPGGVAQGSSAVSITTTWTGLSLFSSLTLSAYFASATQALTGGSPASSIPSLAVLGKMPTGLPTSFTPFTGSAPLGPVGSGLTLYSQVSLLSAGGSRTDALSLEINLASLPQLPAATYSGVLVLQAQAF